MYVALDTDFLSCSYWLLVTYISFFTLPNLLVYLTMPFQLYRLYSFEWQLRYERVCCNDWCLLCKIWLYNLSEPSF